MAVSGHSKWATIKHSKALTDAKRGQAFTKFSRLITVAARKGGSDPNANPALRMAIDKAKKVNMPQGNIQRAIERGAGTGNGGEVLEEATLEGYGPMGVAFLVDIVTDNRNRAVSEVRGVFTHFAGRLGDAGSAAYVFNEEREPNFEIELDEVNQAKVVALMEALADLDDVQEVYTNAQGL